MGSVKDLIVIKVPEPDKAGIGRFIFSDRYSVFDWGEMPDQIEDKGKAICMSSAYFFEKLEDMGIQSHYLGLVEDGKAKKLSELEKPSDTMEFNLLRVIKPELRGNTYDYSIYRKERINFLIPLEIIYRNALPEGSSVFRRLQEGSLQLSDLGLSEMPAPGQVLENPIIDVSTKLESIDRYVTWEEARRICNLSNGEQEELKRRTLLINNLITEETQRFGLFNEDGKVEFGFDENRQLVLVDALGTLDECRFTYDGLPVSKEIARIYYRKTEWYREVERAKKIDRVNWKALVKSSPEPLPEELARSISMVYKAYANELTGRNWFDTPPMQEVLENLKAII